MGVALASSGCAGAAGEESEPVDSSSDALVGGNWKGPYTGGATSSNPVKAGSHVVCEALACTGARVCGIQVWFSGSLDGSACRFYYSYNGINGASHSYTYYVSQQSTPRYYWQAKVSSTPPTVAVTNGAGYPVCQPTADLDAAGYVKSGLCLYLSSGGTHTAQTTSSFNWLVQSII